ncbi:MAG TPA: EVE domain-containing protein [Pyrinomonadaceae bacterium]|jgi:predicted RNA-binding protein with PUA-like domain
MKYYLLKTEPSEYSFSDLQRDHTTVWDGISNPVALRNLREMPEGSKLAIYHTASEKQVVGLATAVTVDAADAKNPRVTIKAVQPLRKPITLAELKSEALFKDSPLVRQGRLSVVPLTPDQYAFIAK